MLFHIFYLKDISIIFLTLLIEWDLHLAMYKLSFAATHNIGHYHQPDHKT
jgi:hypothetical protein